MSAPRPPRSEIARGVARELDRLGVRYRFVRRSRHPAVVLTVGGREVLKCFPGTTGDRFAIHKVLADLRRLIREAA